MEGGYKQKRIDFIEYFSNNILRFQNLLKNI